MTLRKRQRYAHQHQHNRHDRQPSHVARYPEFFSRPCSARSAPGVTQLLLGLYTADAAVYFIVHERIVPMNSNKHHWRAKS